MENKEQIQEIIKIRNITQLIHFTKKKYSINITSWDTQHK